MLYGYWIAKDCVECHKSSYYCNFGQVSRTTEAEKKIGVGESSSFRS